MSSINFYSLLIANQKDRGDSEGKLQGWLDYFIETHCGGLKPRECFIVEDSNDPIPAFLKENIHYYSANLGKVTWLNNGERKGIEYTWDRLWKLCNHDYYYIRDLRLDFGGFAGDNLSSFIRDELDALEFTTPEPLLGTEGCFNKDTTRTFSPYGVEARRQ